MVTGFHKLPAPAYHADPCERPSLSSSIAQILLNESPRKAWFSHPRLNPAYQVDNDKKFDLGTCAHAILLENDSSKIVVVNADDWRKKDAKEQRDAAYAIGKTPLLAYQHEAAIRMVNAAQAFIPQSEIAPYWQDGESEMTAIWQEGDIFLRCRFDRISQDRRLIMDYKTTERSVAPESFSRLIVNMGYHVQDAFYRRGARALGVHNPEFVFLAQSVEPPHECSLHGCDPALKEIADTYVEDTVQLWRKCLVGNKWPSYGGRIHWAIPPSWMMKEHEQRIMEAA